MKKYKRRRKGKEGNLENNDAGNLPCRRRIFKCHSKCPSHHLTLHRHKHYNTKMTKIPLL